MHVEGVRSTVAAFNLLPAAASRSLRERTLELSGTLARKVEAAGHADSGQSSLVASTVKANKDRVPSITAGGSTRVGSRRKPAFKILFGSEFGSNRLRQFRPHLGSGSYWFFRTVEDNQAEISDAWNDVADDIIREFGRG
jgi:hypothetical protein